MIKHIVAASSIIAFILLVILGFVWYSNHFKLESEINVVDLATFGLTLFLAWYVPNILEKKATGERFEKEMLIKRIERIEELFLSIQNIVNKTTLPSTMTSDQALNINSLLTDISRNLRTFEKLIIECGYDTLTVDKTDLVNKRLGYKQKVTGGQFQQSGFGYSSSQASQIAIVYTEIELICSMMIIKINRL